AVEHNITGFVLRGGANYFLQLLFQVGAQVIGLRSAEAFRQAAHINRGGAKVHIHQLAQNRQGFSRPEVAVDQAAGVAVGLNDVDIGDTNEQSTKNGDRKSTRLNSSHVSISYAVFYLREKRERQAINEMTF